MLFKNKYFIFALLFSTAIYANNVDLDNNSSNKTLTNKVDPFKEFQLMQQEFDKIFSRFNSRFANDPFFSRSFHNDFSFKPLLDMSQDSDGYTIKMDIPGSKFNNIETEVKNNILTVKAKVDEYKENNSSSYITRERYINRFQRSVLLPKDAESSKMSSDYKDGVLIIKIPKL